MKMTSLAKATDRSNAIPSKGPKSILTDRKKEKTILKLIRRYTREGQPMQSEQNEYGQR